MGGGRGLKLRRRGFHYRDRALPCIQLDGNPLTDRQVSKEFRFRDMEDHFPVEIGGQPSLFFCQIDLQEGPGNGFLLRRRSIRYQKG